MLSIVTPILMLYRLSNPAVLPTVCLQASLDLFDEAGMDNLREKSLLLTGYLGKIEDV